MQSGAAFHLGFDVIVETAQRGFIVSKQMHFHRNGFECFRLGLQVACCFEVGNECLYGSHVTGAQYDHIGAAGGHDHALAGGHEFLGVIPPFFEISSRNDWAVEFFFKSIKRHAVPMALEHVGG